ncbi:MAG: hypothetical protein HFI40_02600 [Lachnospiraceae bacterium]|jgi:hypothetical protein|nr:hypothetical protein [Lachnospiraceae bacterium]
MKINASSVAMTSSRSYQESTAVQTSSIIFKGKGSLGSAGTSKNKIGKDKSNRALSTPTQRLLDQLKQEERDRQSQTMFGNGLGTRQVGQREDLTESKESLEIEALRKLLEALRRMREGFRDGKWSLDSVQKLDGLKDTSGQLSTIGRTPWSVQNPLVRPGSSSAQGLSAGIWTRQTVVSSFRSETEMTAFSTTGVVQTADGRSIGFNVQVEMSRSFLEANEYITEDTIRIMSDPLVINLDTNVASVTDQKFLFDLDADGVLDEISFAGQGSGFLALDKNGDGKINDGTELFGTRSGNGFADLAAYDEDGNGWIDENDSVFDKLMVWTKDANGKDKLISIGKAGVGAIYLGNASTDFTLRGEESRAVNGQIRRTGVYLKESGEAGTIQHVDLAL